MPNKYPDGCVMVHWLRLRCEILVVQESYATVMRFMGCKSCCIVKSLRLKILYKS